MKNPSRRSYNRKPVKLVDTRSDAMKKASHLPLLGPGLDVTVPLHLLPEYLERNNVDPIETKLAAHQPLVLKVVRKKKQA